MNNGLEKAKKKVIGRLVLCLCIALAFIGICAYLIVTTRGTEAANEDILMISKILALAGAFFLVMAFGHILPTLIKLNKGGLEASGAFTEENMRILLGKYIPDGETLMAGIRAVANESKVTGVYGKCIPAEDRLIPSEEGGIISLRKEKYSVYDIYIGITQYALIIAECDKNKHLYGIEDVQDVNEADIQNVTSDILFDNIGTRFMFTDIQNCTVKNGPMGANCTVTMNNGSYFKLLLPKASGMLGGMTQHSEYRDAIIAQLEKYSA